MLLTFWQRQSNANGTSFRKGNHKAGRKDKDAGKEWIDR